MIHYELTITHETAYDTGGVSQNMVRRRRKVLTATYATFRGAKNRAMREAKVLAKEKDFDRFWRKIEWSKADPGSGLVGDYELAYNFAKIRIKKIGFEVSRVATRSKSPDWSAIEKELREAGSVWAQPTSKSKGLS